jgi:hypothetical protein
MPSFLTILAVAFLGALNGPWYFLLLGAGMLTFIAIRNNHRRFQPRFAALGITGVLETAAYASVAYALLAAIAAYALGVFARFIFLSS